MKPDFKITREEMLAKIAAAEADRPEIDASMRRVRQAASESTFSGWLRREIHAQRKPIDVVIRESGVSQVDMSEFLEGSGALTSHQVDRLCQCLGIDLAAGTSAPA